jgi:hypothetical protein
MVDIQPYEGGKDAGGGGVGLPLLHIALRPAPPTAHAMTRSPEVATAMADVRLYGGGKGERRGIVGGR